MVFVVTAPVQEHAQNHLIRTKMLLVLFYHLRIYKGFRNSVPGARNKAIYVFSVLSPVS